MPDALLKACPCGCGTLVTKGRCKASARQRDRWRGTRQERGYGAKWERIRARLLREEPFCRRCMDSDVITPSTEVDHIVSKADGGTDERSNLQGLCKPCHSRKTVTEDHGFNRR